MSSTLTSSADTAKKAKALVQIATAVCNVQGIAHKITNFSKAVFGEQDTEAAISAKKQEQAQHIGQNGSFGEGGACSALLRASRILRESLNDEANAEELDRVTLGYFMKDVVVRHRGLVDLESRL